MFLPGIQKKGPVLGVQAPTLKDLVKILKWRGPLLTLVGILLYGAGYGIFISVLPATLIQGKGFDQSSIGWFFTLFYIAISVSQLVVGPLSDKHGRKMYMISGLLMVAFGFASFDAMPGAWTYVPLGLASLGLGFFCVSSLAYLNECVPSSLRGSISGCYYLFWGGGYFLGPLFIGGLSTGAQSILGYYLLALMATGLAGVLWIFRAADDLALSASE
jgi:MFS family permease